MGNLLVARSAEVITPVEPDVVASTIPALVVALIVSVLIPWLTVMITKGMDRRRDERRERIDASLALMRALDENFVAQNAPRKAGENHRTVYSHEINTAVARVLILTNRNRDVGNQALMNLGEVSNRALAAGILGHWVAKGKFRITDLPSRTT